MGEAMFDFFYLIFGLAAFAVSILSIVKSAKAGQKALDNTKMIGLINDNDLKHVKELLGKLENTLEKIEEKIDHNEANISKLYTDVGRIDERCKSYHK
jgi:peptidoglycan hydrolase CwlO-like protein